MFYVREEASKTELKLGIMTNAELAKWFGIKEKSLTDNRKKKLEQLKSYAIFEAERGQVNIIEIIKPVYQKKSNKNQEFVKQKTLEQWDKSGLDTSKLVADKIIKNYHKELNIKETTIYTYTCNGKRELWGKAFSYEGERGYCIYELCKEINNKCIPFTAEEEAIKNKLLKKYYGNTEEKLIYIQDMVNNGEITEAEGWQELKEIADLENKYVLFKNELEKLIQNKVVRATRVFDNEFKTIKVKERKF